MKITFSFGDTKVVVPCGSGSFTIRDLAERAVTRFKNISCKVSQKDRITLYNLKTAEDGGILDWDDSVRDVLDDKDMVIASYRLSQEKVADSTSEPDDSSPSENYLNPLKIQLTDLNINQKEAPPAKEVSNDEVQENVVNFQDNKDQLLSNKQNELQDSFEDNQLKEMKSKTFSALEEVLQRRRELIRHKVDEYDYEDETLSPPLEIRNQSSPKDSSSYSDPKSGFSFQDAVENIPIKKVDNKSSDDGEETFEEDEEDYDDDREDINSEGLQTVRRAMIQKLENDKTRGLILPPPPKDLVDDFESVESYKAQSFEKQIVNPVEVEDDDIDFIPNAPIAATTCQTRIHGNKSPIRTELKISEPKNQIFLSSSTTSIEEPHEPEFGLVVEGYESDDAPPLVAVPSTIVEEDEEDYNTTTEDNEDDSRITKLQFPDSTSHSESKNIDDQIDEDYPMLRKDYFIKHPVNDEKKSMTMNIEKRIKVPVQDNKKDLHYATMPGVNPNILKWLETSQLNENSEVPPDVMNSPNSSQTIKDDSSESWDDRLSSVTSKYNTNREKEYAFSTTSADDIKLVKINNADSRGETLGMQIKPVVSSREKSNSSSSSSSNKGIEVHSITPNGRMDREKLLNIGDRIISINNHDLTSLPFEKCRALFQESLSHDVIEMRIIPNEKSNTLKKKSKSKTPSNKTGCDNSEETLVNGNMVVTDSAMEKDLESKVVINKGNDDNNLLKNIPPPPPRRSPNTSLTIKGASKSDNYEEDTITQLEGSFPPPSFSPPPLPVPNPLKAGNVKKSPEPCLKKETEMISDKKSDGTAKQFSMKLQQESVKISNESLSIIPISLKKGINGLGFSLTTREGVYGKTETKSSCGPVFVKNILPGGSAISNGQLKQGDRLLKVDGIDVTQIGQTKIVGMLRDKPINSTVNITIARSNSISSPYNPGHSSGSSLGAFSSHDESRKASSSSSQDIHSKIISRLSNFGFNNSNLAEYEISLKGYQKKDDQPKSGSMSSQPPITLGVSITIRSSNPNLDPESPEAIKSNAVFVRKLIEGGAAHRDGRLKIGDRLLAIDNQSLSGLSANDALHTLKTEIARDLAEERPCCKLIVCRVNNTSTMGHLSKPGNSDSENGRDDRGSKKGSPKPEPGAVKNNSKRENSQPQSSSSGGEKRSQHFSNDKNLQDNLDDISIKIPELPKRNHKPKTVDDLNKKNPEKYFTQKPSAFSLAASMPKSPKVSPRKGIVTEDEKNTKVTMSLDKNENIVILDQSNQRRNSNSKDPVVGEISSSTIHDDIDVSNIIPKCIMTNKLSDESNPEIKISMTGLINDSFDKDILTGWQDYKPPSPLISPPTRDGMDNTGHLSSFSQKTAQIYRCDSQGTIYSSDFSENELENLNKSVNIRSHEYRSKSAIDCPFDNRREFFINGLPLDQMVAIPLNSSYWKKQEIHDEKIEGPVQKSDNQNSEDIIEICKIPQDNFADLKPINQEEVENQIPSSEDVLLFPSAPSKSQSKSQQPLDSVSLISDTSRKSVILSKMIKFVRPQYYFRKRSSSQSNEIIPKRDNRNLVGWSSVNGRPAFSRRINSASNVFCNMSVISVPTVTNKFKNQTDPIVPERRIKTKTFSHSSDHITRSTQSNRVSMLLRCCEESCSPDVIHRKELSQERPKSQNSVLPSSATVKSLNTIDYSHDTVTIEKLYEKLKEFKDSELIVNSSNSALCRTQQPLVQAYRHHDFLQKRKSLSPKKHPPVYNPSPCCKKISEEKKVQPCQGDISQNTPSQPSLTSNQKRVNFSPEVQPKAVTLASPESSLSYRSSVSSDSNYPTYERRPISGYLLTKDLQQQIPESNYSELTFDSRTMSRASNSSTLTRSSSKRPLRVPSDSQNFYMSGQMGSAIALRSPTPQQSQGQFILLDQINRPIQHEKSKVNKPDSKPILEDAEQLYTKIKNKFISKPQQTIQIPQYSPQFNNAFHPNMNLINNRIVKNIYLTQPRPLRQSELYYDSSIYHNMTLTRPNQIGSIPASSPMSRISSPNNLMKPILIKNRSNNNEPIYAKVNKIYVLPTTPLEN